MRRSACAATAFAILLIGGTARLAAQTGTIRGHVVRADSPLGLSDAYLEVRPSGARARTDARGFFVFTGIPTGQVEVAVRRVGFASAVVVLRVESLAVTEVDIPLEPVAINLDPIVTSATRDARSLSNVAAAVSVADTSAIGRDRTVGLHETLRMMPGVQVTSRYGGMEDVRIGIRGSASRAPQAVRGVGVLLDGIALTESDGVARLDLIELAASRQVEVVRGPVSALYAGSPGGVVNIVSRTGRDSRGISVRALRGAFGFQKYDGHAGGVFAGKRGSGFAAASYTSADGYREHSDGDILRGQMAFDYVVAPGTRLDIQANGSRIDLRLPGSQNQEQFDADPNEAGAGVALGLRRGDTRYRAGARLEHVVGNGIASGYVFYGGRTLDFPTMQRIVDLNLHRLQGGARLRADRVARTPLDATIGFDYDNIFGTDHRWDNNGGGTRGSLSDDGYFAVPNFGAYSQVEWQAARLLDVTLGLRYDRVLYHFESYLSELMPEQERVFDQFSPRLSSVWSADSATSLYASIGRGVEVPAIGEVSASPGAQLSLLRPKSLWNYEVGARRIMGGRVRLEGSIFYARVRGEFVPRTVNNLNRLENAGRSRNIGVELGATARATRHIELQAGYAFLDLRLRDYTSTVVDADGTSRAVDFAGKLLPAVPRHRLTGEARVSPRPALDLGAQLEWQGVVYVESGNADAGFWYYRPQPGAPVQQVPFRVVPSRALVHLNAAWRLGPATLFGSVENLFGRKYAGSVVANESLGRFYESGSPASVSVGLRVTGWATSDPRP